MLQLVEVGRRSIDQYSEIVGKQAILELKEIAKSLTGLKVLNVNATPYGGGVSEMLRSLIPLECDLGIDVEWRVISGDTRFFRVTKNFHNALQGSDYSPDTEDKETYLAFNDHNATMLNMLEKEYDIIVVHDPQPAAIRHFVTNSKPGSSTKWIWRCHIDTSEPNTEVWNFLHPFISQYDSIIFTMEEFLPPDLLEHKVNIMIPAIDPLSPKNFPISQELARNIISWIGIPPDSHLILQVSRFDPWKDPLGVIEAYRLARKEIGKVQLALIGSMALDDPQGWDIYAQIMKEAENDNQLFVFTNLTGVSNIEVNAFQRLADVVVQKSIREGFGLVVSEALWKGTPVVGGRAGGIPMQLQHGGGHLIDTVDECAGKIIEILEHPGKAAEMSVAGPLNVKERFLLPRLIKDELILFRSLMNK